MIRMITFSNWSLLIIVLILHPAHIVNFVNKITHYIPTEENITQSFNQKGQLISWDQKASYLRVWTNDRNTFFPTQARNNTSRW